MRVKLELAVIYKCEYSMLTLFFTLTLYRCSADIDNIMSISCKGPLISPVWRPRVVQRFSEGPGSEKPVCPALSGGGLLSFVSSVAFREKAK